MTATRNIRPNRTASVERAKAETAIVHELALATAAYLEVPVYKVLLSDDFVNKAYEIAERKLGPQ